MLTTDPFSGPRIEQVASAVSVVSAGAAVAVEAVTALRQFVAVAVAVAVTVAVGRRDWLLRLLRWTWRTSGVCSVPSSLCSLDVGSDALREVQEGTCTG